METIYILMVLTILITAITILLIHYEFNDSKKEYESLKKKIEDRTTEINDFISSQNNNIMTIKKFDKELCKMNEFSDLNRCKILNLSEGE
tara:strand:- start:640 stop:909 length:270 start_codon:yes stop_codon:yes gene_type:complete